MEESWCLTQTRTQHLKTHSQFWKLVQIFGVIVLTTNITLRRGGILNSHSNTKEKFRIPHLRSAARREMDVWILQTRNLSFCFAWIRLMKDSREKSGHNLEHWSTYCLFSEQCLCNTAPIVTSLQRHLYWTTKTQSTLAHSSHVKSALLLRGLSTVLNTMWKQSMKVMFISVKSVEKHFLMSAT